MAPIERAARALYRSAPHDYDPNQIGEDASWPDLVEQVRAVLAAIREPSEGVLRAMRDTVPIDGPDWDYVDAETSPHWRAMINALLEEAQ